jgi:hypothetical protein
MSLPAHVDQGVGTLLLSHARRNCSFRYGSGASRETRVPGASTNGAASMRIRFTDGRANEERLPDILYELAS